MPVSRDPASELALAMADDEAAEDHCAAALDWLEVGAERTPLPVSYQVKRQAWLDLVRSSSDLTPRSHRRRTAPALPPD